LTGRKNSIWPAISPAGDTMSRVPSSFCQKPVSANSVRIRDSDATPSGKKAPRLVISACAA